MKREDYEKRNVKTGKVKIETESNLGNTIIENETLNDNSNDYYDEDFGETVHTETGISHEVIEEVEEPVVVEEPKQPVKKPKKPLSEKRLKQLEKARKKSRLAYQKRKEQREQEMIEAEVERRLNQRLKKGECLSSQTPTLTQKRGEQKPVKEPVQERSRIVSNTPVETVPVSLPQIPQKSQRDLEAEELAKMFGW